MASKHYYEYIGGNSKKFWQIEEPFIGSDAKSWVVRVHFGRIGTAGQHHYKVFWSPLKAQIYYGQKVDEKLRKGYKYVSLIKTKPGDKTPIDQLDQQSKMIPPQKKILKSILVGHDGIIVPALPKKKEKECEHLQLRKTGERKWECNSCKTHIEFDKPQTVATTVVEEVTQVRRYIDLSALRG